MDRTGTARLSAANLAKLPKSERVDALLSLAQMNIAAEEDASHLLSQVQEEMDRSSYGRPGTGRSQHAPPSTAGKPPSTAGGLSIAGSLKGRIQESILSRESQFRKGHGALRPGGASRPGTGLSQMPPSTAASQRPPPTAASERPPTGDAPRVLNLVEKPPIYDYTEIMPEHMVQKFREEFRAMKAAEAAAAAEAEAAAMRPGTGMSRFSRPATGEPLAEMHNLVNERPPTGRSQASRPLTGHSERSLSKPPPTAPEPRPWSKKGRRGAPANVRSSAISEALSWE